MLKSLGTWLGLALGNLQSCSLSAERPRGGMSTPLKGPRRHTGCLEGGTWGLSRRQRSAHSHPCLHFQTEKESLVPSAGGGEGGGDALPSVRRGSGLSPLPPSAGQRVCGHRLPTSCPVSAHLAALPVRYLGHYLRACGEGSLHQQTRMLNLYLQV